TKTADVRVAHIIHVDDDDIGRPLGGPPGFRPPGLRFGPCRADFALEAARERFPQLRHVFSFSPLPMCVVLLQTVRPCFTGPLPPGETPGRAWQYPRRSAVQ